MSDKKELDVNAMPPSATELRQEVKKRESEEFDRRTAEAAEDELPPTPG